MSNMEEGIEESIELLLKPYNLTINKIQDIYVDIDGVLVINDKYRFKLIKED
jgi:hypothetical protein